MNTIGTILVLGVILGAIYALVGLGLVVLYRATHVINFAQGDIATVGLYIGLLMVESHIPYWIVAIVVAIAGGVMSGGLGALFGWKWFARRSPVELVVATVGASLVIQGTASSVTGGQTYTFPSLGSSVVFQVASARISVADLSSVLISVLVFLLLGLFFKMTATGKSMRAIAEDEEESRALGLRIALLKNTSWVVAGVLAAIGGLFVVPIYSLSPSSVDVLLVYGFAVVVVGGFESFAGAAVVGIAVGIIQSLIGVYVSASYVLPLLVAGMIIALLFRPAGLFGTSHAERV